MRDLIEQRFGRLEVIKQVGRDKHRKILWLCKCDCGQEKIIQGCRLRNGKTQSCGCLQMERIIQANTKHGHCKDRKISKIYQSWADMIQRCTNPNHQGYHNYGGRGITVCERWMQFENFNEDMGRGWELGPTLERIKNNEGYCKENCKWATKTEQQRNKRNNRLITYNGKTQCLAEWANETGIHQSIIWKRLKRDWSIEKALTTPTKKKRRQ